MLHFQFSEHLGRCQHSNPRMYEYIHVYLKKNKERSNTTSGVGTQNQFFFSIHIVFQYRYITISIFYTNSVFQIQFSEQWS